MRYVTYPPDCAAMDKANEEAWAKYPHLKRRKITMADDDAKYRAAWMEAYQKYCDDPKKRISSNNPHLIPGQLTELCRPNKTLATLVIKVINSLSHHPVGGAKVSISGPERHTNVADNGMAMFTNIQEGIYDIIAEKDYYTIGSKTSWVYSATEIVEEIDLNPGSIYFAIYYIVGDRAFERAAETWRAGIQRRSTYRPNIDRFLMHGVRTESKFRKAWNQVYAEASSEFPVVEGQLFLHASLDDESTRGLEFTADTLRQDEIAALPRLNWQPGNSRLTLAACNTGVVRGKSSPAQVFAKRQQVTTIGQAGYSYFSEQWNVHDRVDSFGDDPVYLWAYDRRSNARGRIGSDRRIPGVVCEL